MDLKIKEVLKEKGLTITQLSEVMGINRVNLSNMINGNPTAETLEKIADALGVPVWRLLVSPDEVTGRELTALVEHENNYYHAHTVDELSAIVEELKKKTKGKE